MIGLGAVYAVAGLVFLGFALLALRARNPWHAGFYALIATSFLAGDLLGDSANGALALALAAIAGTGRLRAPAAGAPAGDRDAARGDGLFAIALVIPVTALLGTFVFKAWPGLVAPGQATLVALTLGMLMALALCYAMLRPGPLAPFVEGARLMDMVGWAALLPQMLASLGAVFAVAHVGAVVGGLVGAAIPAGSLIAAVLAYALGMVLFTLVMGNAFAAFPVMIGAVGMPVLIRDHHGDPAVIAALGMLAGFCGTLLTPMAANFNLVPAALLGLRDRYAVIRAQAPTALPLLGVIILLLWWCGFR
ncbi:5-oxoproline transporter, DUF979 family subunit [Sphingomonas morindae]|uniref:DUF979 domain-containing protein n=1 Tax=Sphingomonas morindae TaxID=1541170 RepID=A0ABY4XBH2_9SPHN|nr:DUF979 family protein [Sphingomonas morindae]USI74327.1 DUF979 domain-containing protein [Sphingomonas morindae]